MGDYSKMRVTPIEACSQSEIIEKTVKTVKTCRAEKLHCPGYL